MDFKALENSTLVSENENGSRTYTAIATTGEKGTPKRKEEAFTFPFYPSLDVARAVLTDDGVLDLLARQIKTDLMNKKRNEMNAKKSAAAMMAKVMKDVAEGKATPEQAKLAFAAAMAQAEAEAAEAADRAAEAGDAEAADGEAEEGGSVA